MAKSNNKTHQKRMDKNCQVEEQNVSNEFYILWIKNLKMTESKMFIGSTGFDYLAGHV